MLHFMSHKIFDTAFGDIYPHYVAKVERKGHSVSELHTVITWLTGYDDADIAEINANGTTMAQFFDQAPALNANRELITGSICGYKVQEIADPLMQNIRYLDKLVDEVARGKAMSKILRG